LKSLSEIEDALLFFISYLGASVYPNVSNLSSNAESSAERDFSSSTNY
jgi:hypothetical protein